LILALLVCWLLGWGIVRTRTGRRVKQWVVETLLKRTPVYQTYRRVTGHVVDTPDTPHSIKSTLIAIIGKAFVTVIKGCFEGSDKGSNEITRDRL